MRRLWMIGFGSLVAMIALSVTGCSDDDPVQPGGTDYLDQSTPEAVIATLEESWRRKDSETYEKLLRHDFVFKFQEADAGAIGTESWTRDQDIAGVSGLFGAPDISDITIELIHGPAVQSDDLDLPNAMKIRVSPTQLDVIRLPDTTLRVDGDIQDFFLEQGDADRGEDPDLWYIVDWRDLPGSPFAKPAAVEQPTWGQIKSLYR